MPSGYPDYQSFELAVPVPSGGTGLSVLTLNGVLIGKDVAMLKVSNAGAANEVFRVPAAGGEPAFGQIDLTAAASAIDGARVYNSAAETFGTGSDAALTFNAERYDNGGLHDNVTNNSRLTAQKAGTYLITGHVAFAANATGKRRVTIVKGGTVSIAAQERLASATDVSYLSVATLYHLSALEYVELFAYQDSGGNLDVSALLQRSPEFAMQWLGP